MGDFAEVMSEIISDIGSGFAVMGVMLLKFLTLFVWAFTGVFVLFCVFVANVFYPMWTDWAEKLKK
ncbi:MAG: hypothetical protein Q7R78_00205 [bacterium]|nr:hypothetical protein [bacterium]